MDNFEIPHQNTISSLVEQYKKLLSVQNQQKYEPFHETDQFDKYGIIYDPLQTNFPDLQLSIIDESINSQAVLIQAKWGKFTTILSVLNIDNESIFHGIVFGKGNYGKIYRSNLKEQQFLIKCCHFENNKFTNLIKINAFKEFIMLKIAAALKVGPEVKKWMGFDLIINRHCIQFAMEKCQQIQQLNYNVKQQIKNQLKLMHSYKIIHFDIKPQHIMFSNSHQSAVFIDFGLSCLVETEIGIKSKTEFRGTLQYCSQQMWNIFEMEQDGLVDVYYNDAYCLNGSLQCLSKYFQLKKTYPIASYFQSQQNQTISSDYQNKENYGIILLLIKYNIFQNNISDLTKLFATYNDYIYEYLIFTIFQFLMEVHPSQKLKMFYQSSIDSYHKEGIQYKQLNLIYSLNKKSIRHDYVLQEKKVKFRNFFQNIIKSKDYLSVPLVLNKITIRQWLQSAKHQPYLIERELFIRVYLKYISFSNNIYEVSMEDRVIVTKQLCLCYLDKKYRRNSTESNLQFVKRIIRAIFQGYFSQQKQKQSKYQTKVNYMLNIYDLLEHLFILKIGTSKQLTNWGQKILNLPRLDYSDRLQLIIKMKHSSFWLYHMPTSNKYAEINHKFYLQIIKWCKLKLTNLMAKTHQSCWWVAQLLKNNMENKYIKILDDEEIKKCRKIKPLLACLFRIDLLFTKLMNTRTQETGIVIEEIYELIPSHQKQKIFFFSMDIYQINFSKTFLHQKCLQIQRQFNKNLNCKQLQKLIFFDYKQKSITSQFSIDDSSNMKYLRYLQQCIGVYAFIFDHEQIHFGLQTLFFTRGFNIIQSIRQSQKIQFWQIIAKSRQLIGSINFQNYPNIKIKCIWFSMLANLLGNLSLFNLLNKYGLNFNKLLQILTNSLNKLQCQLCKQFTFSLFLLQLQKYLNHQPLQNQYIDAVFAQSYNTLIYLSKKVAFTRQNLCISNANAMNMLQFCLKNKVRQQKLHGVLGYYHILKQNHKLSNYLYYTDIHPKLLHATLNVLFANKSLDQLIVLLVTLSGQIAKDFSKCHFYHLFTNYKNFVAENYLQINWRVFFNQLEAVSSKYCAKNYCNIIYYYVALFYANADILRKISINICLFLKYLPINIQRYFEVDIYQAELSNIKSDQFGSNRKQIALTFRIIRLYKILGKESSSIKVYSVKDKNKHQKWLQNKVTKFGGPYPSNFPKINILYMRIHNQ